MSKSQSAVQTNHTSADTSVSSRGVSMLLLDFYPKPVRLIPQSGEHVCCHPSRHNSIVTGGKPLQGPLHQIGESSFFLLLYYFSICFLHFPKSCAFCLVFAVYVGQIQGSLTHVLV